MYVSVFLVLLLYLFYVIFNKDVVDYNDSFFLLELNYVFFNYFYVFLIKVSVFVVYIILCMWVLR